LIRVFVRAGSAVELAGLEALAKSASFMELAGSSLTGADSGPGSVATDSDVIVERPLLDEAGEAQFDGADEPGQVRVWLLAEPEFEMGLAAVREGVVRALLPVWASAEEIRSAIQAAASGLLVLHPDIAEHAIFANPRAGGGDSAAGPGQQLSPREAEVLNLLAAGLGNKQIAPRLGISEHTVKFHVTSIFNKLGASSRAEAVAIGLRRGLIIL
jgi:DNA-binding CsgD family transcriptional regulator